MPIYEESSAPSYPLMEDHTVLRAEVVRVEERESDRYRDDDGNPQKQVNFKFKVVEEGDAQGNVYFGTTPAFWNNSDKCKLRAWAGGIANRSYAPGEPLDTDLLEHRFCRIVLGVKKKLNGEYVNRVIDVMHDKLSEPLASTVPQPSHQEPF